jgi:glycosyltransferase involved in cell wall biosynthesis
MPERRNRQRTVLWWSRSGREYSRNRVIRSAFESLGWQVNDFKARFNAAGSLQAHWQGIATPDLVWVPCFRQRELAAAVRWARRRAVPVAFDPLISAWDKQVFERQKISEDSLRSRMLLNWERRLLSQCDLVIADTSCHRDFFRDQLRVPESRLNVIPVGAEESIFEPQPPPSGDGSGRALFYGSFIGLQGPEVIAEAAAAAADVHWTFLGDGPLRQTCQQLTAGCSHVEFLPWMKYESLPATIARADVLLGVFGTSDKAARVIPNKVFQALACGRPVVTRHSSAYPEPLALDASGNQGLVWVDGGDAAGLVQAVRGLLTDRVRLSNLAEAAQTTYQQWFSSAAISDALQHALHRAGLSEMAGVKDPARGG